MNNEKFIEVRCPTTNEHKIRDVQYHTCGQLLGGIGTVENSQALFRCPQCGKFWSVTVKNSSVMEFNEMSTSKTNKIKLQKQWRLINELR